MSAVATAPVRHVRIAAIMGTVFSIHLIVEGGMPVAGEAAAEACFAQLRELDRVFSPFRADSDISRLRRGELAAQRADPRVDDVRRACARLLEQTAGRFDAWRDGWFDPTGYVKGWAAERAARAHLAPLLCVDGTVAVGLNAGGDLQVFTAPDADWSWSIGIADPHRPGAVLATVALRDGAVATSGTAERGAHIVDPHTGRAAIAVASATTIADSLTDADVWATVAVAAGADDLDWVAVAPIRSALLVDRAGAVRRWAGGIEVVEVSAVENGRRVTIPPPPLKLYRTLP